MKEAFRALFRFSRIERLGIIALSFLILIIVIANLFLRQWLKPDAPNAARLAAMQSDYNAWLSQQETNNPDFTNALNAPSGAAFRLFLFDPNTLDSIGFVQLGMPPKAIKGLLNWRSKGKHFYKAEDLKPLYSLPEEVFTRIEPFVRIAATESDNRFAKSNSFRLGFQIRHPFHCCVPPRITFHSARYFSAKVLSSNTMTMFSAFLFSAAAEFTFRKKFRKVWLTALRESWTNPNNSLNPPQL